MCCNIKLIDSSCLAASQVDLATMINGINESSKRWTLINCPPIVETVKRNLMTVKSNFGRKSVEFIKALWTVLRLVRCRRIRENSKAELTRKSSKIILAYCLRSKLGFSVIVVPFLRLWRIKSASKGTFKNIYKENLKITALTKARRNSK